MNTEQVERLLNCVPLKKQFALELWCNTRGTRFNPYLKESVTYEAAENLFRKLYPYAIDQDVVARFAVKWVSDPVVVQTYLQLQSGKNEIADCIQDEIFSKGTFIVEIIEFMALVNPALRRSYANLARDTLAPLLGLNWDATVAAYDGGRA